MYILGIESSCDETAASVAVDGRDIRSNVVSSWRCGRAMPLPSPCTSPWDTGRWGCAPGIITSRMRMGCSCGKM